MVLAVLACAAPACRLFTDVGGLVVEGAARQVASVPGVRVVASAGSGDDTVVDLVREAEEPWHCIVVTADKGLRRRVRDQGADVRGPGLVPRR